MKKIFNRSGLFAKTLASWSAFAVMSTASAPAFAGTSMLGGNAVLDQAMRAEVTRNDADYAQFSSSSATAVLDWSKYNIGSGQTMDFVGAGTTFFNLVSATAGKSQIDGMIKGDGNVWVINPNGVAFGANSTVNVGGLFAAAAGNVENADALRDGSATMPSFSSFGGEVSSAAGARFSADQVALLGKTVSAAGSFDVAKLDIGAGGLMSVDEVAGGRVAVNVAAFAADPSEASLFLGDLVASGDVRAVADGSLEVSADSTVSVDGSTLGSYGVVSLYTKQGNIVVEEGATVESTASGGSVNMVSAMEDYLFGHGDIAVKGDVSADEVNIYAGYGFFNGGDVTVDGNVTAGSVGAAVYSGFGYGSDGGDLTVNGSVRSTGAVDIEAGVGYGYGADGNLRIDGEVKGVGVSLYSHVGTDGVSGSGSVDAGDSELVVYAGGGSVGLDGVVRAGDVMAIAAEDVSLANGNNDFSGSVSAYGNDVSISDVNGVSLAGVTARTGDANVFTASGNIRVAGGSVVSAPNGGVNLVSAMTADGSGDVVVDADAAVSAGKTVRLYAGYGNGEVSSSGDVVVHGAVVAGEMVDVDAADWMRGEGGIAALSTTGAIYANAGRGISFDGTVTSWATRLTSDGGIEMSNAANSFGFLSASTQGSLALRNGSDDLALLNVKAVQGDVDIKTDGYLAVVGAVESGDATSLYSMRDWLDIFGSGSVLAANEVSLSAPQGVGAAGGSLVSVEGGRLSAESSDGNVELHGTVMAKSADLKAAGAVFAENRENDFTGTVRADGAIVWLQDRNDLSLGDVSANSVESIGEYVDPVTGELADATMSIQVVAGGKVTVEAGSIVESSHEHGWIDIRSQGESGGIDMGGSLVAKGDGGDDGIAVSVYALNGDVNIGGSVSSGSIATVTAADGSVNVGGTVEAAGDSMLTASGGDVRVDGQLKSDEVAFATAYGGNVVVNGRIVGSEAAMVESNNGDVRINGSVASDGADGAVLLLAKGRGDVAFGANGRVSSTEFVIVKTENGNVTQTGSSISEKDGYVPAKSFAPAVSADEILFNVNGSIGSGTYDYVAIDGKVYAFATGDASIAAANGSSLKGGQNIADIRNAFDGVVSLDTASADWDNNMVKADGNLSVYTAGKIENNGLMVAGGDLTASAASFGDLSYLQAGGTLTVNNVGRPSSPQIAYFESVNGNEPRIRNLPNDTVIFVDGRLAGGNLKTLNQFGANEAFLVATPELKSTQGIFGNPPFLHGDLDVANPMEVSAIDYLIQDIPRLTLASEFPAAVDKNIEANGLSERDVIRFGK